MIDCQLASFKAGFFPWSQSAGVADLQAAILVRQAAVGQEHPVASGYPREDHFACNSAMAGLKWSSRNRKIGTMKTRKKLGCLVGIATLTAVVTFAQAAPMPVNSCSNEDQKAVYRDLFDKDQMLRRPGVRAEPNLRDRLQRQDAENQIQLDMIVEACGWPQDGPYRDSNLEVAFLVVQHSWKEFTDRYRGRVEDSYAKGLIPQGQMDNFRRYLDIKDRRGK